MTTRMTLDLKNPLYIKQLKHIAAEEGKSLREIVTEALDAYFSDYLENRAIKTLAEAAFDEWDNTKDADYDKL